MSDELNMSSVTADPAPEPAGKRAAPEEKPPKTPGKRAGLIIGIAAAVLVLAYAGCCVAANALYSHTAFPNTSVLGMICPACRRRRPSSAGRSRGVPCWTA